MNRWYRVATMACAALLLVGARQPSVAQASVPEDIRRFAEAFQRVVRAYDVDAWVALVSEDVVMMAPNGRVVEGRTAFRDLWSRSFEGQTGPNPLMVSVRDVRVGGDLAVVRASYGPEGADPVGQYVWVLERAGADRPWLLSWWMLTRVG